MSQVQNREVGFLARAYLRFKRELLLTLASTDGLGLLESGVFDAYQNTLGLTPLDWQQSRLQAWELGNSLSQIATDSFSMGNQRYNQHLDQLDDLRSEQFGPTVYVISSNGQGDQEQCDETRHTPGTINRKKYPVWESPLDLKLAVGQNAYSIEIDGLLGQIQSGHQQARSSWQFKRILDDIGIGLNFLVEKAVSEYKNTWHNMQQEAQQSQAATGPLTTRRAQREIGKRQLVLLVNEKDLVDRKQKLEEQQAILRKQQFQFSLTLQGHKSAFLAQKERLVQRERDLEYGRGGCQSQSTKDSQQWQLSRKRMDLLSQKVTFQSFRKDALFQIGKQNSMIDANILPRLKSLHSRMNIQPF